MYTCTFFYRWSPEFLTNQWLQTQCILKISTRVAKIILQQVPVSIFSNVYFPLNTVVGKKWEKASYLFWLKINVLTRCLINLWIDSLFGWLENFSVGIWTKGDSAHFCNQPFYVLLTVMNIVAYCIYIYMYTLKSIFKVKQTINLVPLQLQCSSIKKIYR